VKRWVSLVCVAEIALAMSVALLDCGACRRSPSLAWLGVGFYAALALMIWTPRAQGWCVLLMRFAFVSHMALVLAMVRTGEYCVICLGCAALSIPLVLMSMREDPRPAWKPGLEILPLFLAAWAVTTAMIRPAPVVAEESAASTELIVFRSDRCPHCAEFERDVIPKIPPDIPVRFLDADRFEFIRMTPTLLIRRPEGNRIIEGAPDLQVLLQALR
jgi:hypothetical protein